MIKYVPNSSILFCLFHVNVQVKANFTLVHIGCPPGYRLDESQVCQCEERAEVLACDDINMDFVLLDVSGHCSWY